VVKSLLAADTLEERRAIPGLDERRADIILGGALILEQVMAELDIEQLILSDYALREGVLLDGRARQQGAALHHLRDLRQRSVEHLVQLMDDDPDHSTQAARLALELFDGTRELHGLGDDRRELLEAAARLANVGRFVSHDKHHKHSYYVIRNTDQMMGFTDHEIALIATIARYHRKSAPKDSHEEYRQLRDDDREVVWTLAVLLRLAFALDRSRGAFVGHVHAIMQPTDDGDRLVISVEPVPEADLSLELYSAEDRTDELAAVLGLPVVIAGAAWA
jgi:exopolyphosphatase/guanosine-5'-triphosphate,3'-diphosphate pyrophosphatase